MSYRVIVQPQAKDDIDQVLMYLVRHASPDVAARCWRMRSASFTCATRPVGPCRSREACPVFDR